NMRTVSRNEATSTDHTSASGNSGLRVFYAARCLSISSSAFAAKSQLRRRIDKSTSGQITGPPCGMLSHRQQEGSELNTSKQVRIQLFCVRTRPSSFFHRGSRSARGFYLQNQSPGFRCRYTETLPWH